jgi:hypothetical protein
VLLKSVALADNGAQLTDHVWMDARNSLGNIKPGTAIEFSARVKTYEKNKMRNKQKDFGLTHPSRLELLPEPPYKQLELNLWGVA